MCLFFLPLGKTAHANHALTLLMNGDFFLSSIQSSRKLPEAYLKAWSTSTVTVPSNTSPDLAHGIHCLLQHCHLLFFNPVCKRTLDGDLVRLVNLWRQQSVACRFEFPQELDMYKYTVRGLEEREASEAAGNSEEGPPSITSAPSNPEQYRYHLKGIVVHSGTAFAGHYYSYIKASLLISHYLRY